MIELEAEVLVDAGARVGEGPRWDADLHRLLWVDIDGERVHVTDPEGNDRTYAVGAKVSAAAPRKGGGALLAVAQGIAALDLVSGAVEHLHRVEKPDDVVMNDGACDPTGRFWVGSTALDERADAGKLYRFDADLTLHEMLAPVSVSNGLAWSPSSDAMYYIDSADETVDVFDFDARSGTISNRRTLVSVASDDGNPDGLTVDDDGGIWVALFGGAQVRRYTPEGDLAGIIHVPTDNVTSCGFGGPDGATLFITTAADHLEPERRASQPHAGALFIARPGVSGPAATPFAG